LRIEQKLVNIIFCIYFCGMATVVIMPRQGQSVESCILTGIKKGKGAEVAPGDILFSYETDKAAFEEEARVAGTVLEVFFEEGDEVPVLTNVMVIGAPGESVAEFVGGSAEVETAAEAAPAATQTRPAVEVFETATPAVAAVATTSGSSGAVSPRARALADRLGVDAGALSGSGPEGRVIERDVKAATRATALAAGMMRDGMSAPATGSGLAGMIRSVDLAAGGGSKAPAGEDSVVVPLTNMRKLIARAMHASLTNSAQLTHHLAADARRVLELRKQAKAAGRNITINDFVCWAVVRALEKFPAVNAHFLGEKEGVRRFAGVHLALAVDTERGLMVPVVRNADRMSIEHLAAGLKEVAEACKKGSINPDLLAPAAASFTVSNLGNYGVEMFTPIINLPQVAILGVNTIVPRPKDLGEGVYAFVPHMGLSLTYDHRAIDGGEATRFLKQIATEMGNLELT
jgi:pyruvate dehydrogenase E2 component (dihydrolipoamide acetyltransferase)